MAESRISQLITEAVQSGVGSARYSQIVSEIIQSGWATVRSSQLVLEVVHDVDSFSVISLDSIGEIIFGSVVIR